MLAKKLFGFRTFEPIAAKQKASARTRSDFGIPLYVFFNFLISALVLVLVTYDEKLPVSRKSRSNVFPFINIIRRIDFGVFQ